MKLPARRLYDRFFLPHTFILIAEGKFSYVAFGVFSLSLTFLIFTKLAMNGGQVHDPKLRSIGLPDFSCRESNWIS